MNFDRFKTLITLGNATITAYTRDNCPQMAAAIAYHILFSIVPLVMFVFAVVGLILGADDAQRLTDEISQRLDLTTADITLELNDDGAERIESEYGAGAVEEIESALRTANADDAFEEQRSTAANTLLDDGTIEIAGYTLSEEDIDLHFDNLVLETLRGAIESSGTFSVISFLFLLYAATGLFGVVRRSLDFVWNVPRRLPMVTGKLRDLALLFILLVLVVSVLTLLAVLSVAASFFFTFVEEWREDAAWIETSFWRAVSLSVPMLFSFVLFIMLYRYGPRTHNSFKNVWLGAVLAAVGFEILKFGYGIYLANFASYDAFYGALAGVLLFLLFVYLSAQVFLFGAEVGAELPRVLAGEYDEPLEAIAKPMSLRQRVETMIRSLFTNTPAP